MSWAKHDTEGWMEVCRKGVIRKFEAAYHGQTGEHFSDVDELMLQEILHGLIDGDSQDQKIWDALLTWANSEVCAADSDRFAAQVDDAMNQGKAAREKG